MSLITEKNVTIMGTSHIVTPPHVTESLSVPEDNMMLVSNARFNAAVNTGSVNAAMRVALDKVIPAGSIILKIIVNVVEAVTRNNKLGGSPSADISIGLYTNNDLLTPTSWDAVPFDAPTVHTLSGDFNNEVTTQEFSSIAVNVTNETLNTGKFDVKIRYMLA
jgi:hypothetical protein